MRIKGTAAGIGLVTLMIGGILLSMAAGYWATEGSKVPVKYGEGEFAGEFNPADIRGSYSLADIERAFDIPVSTLAAAFGLSAEENPGSVQVKAFEERFGIVEGKEIGTDSMRYFVALYKGLPFLAEEDTALPRPAISILRQEGSMSSDNLALASERAVSLESFHTESTGEASDARGDSEVREIKGKTLFAELYDWGVTKEEIEAILGIPAGVRSQSVRDYCMKNGIEFSTVKGTIQELLDSKS